MGREPRDGVLPARGERRVRHLHPPRVLRRQPLQRHRTAQAGQSRRHPVQVSHTDDDAADDDVDDVDDDDDIYM